MQHNYAHEEIAAAETTSDLSSNRIIEVDFRNDKRWLDFICSHPRALVYHHPGWLASLENEYDQGCLALASVTSEGVFRGILPLFYTRGLPLHLGNHPLGRRLSSLPRTPLAGPVADDLKTAAALVEAAATRAAGEPGVELEVKSTIEDLDALVPGLICVRWRDTYIRNLPHSIAFAGSDGSRCGSCDTCADLRFGNARDNHRVRWAVKMATRNGLHLRIAEAEQELREWYQMYLDGMRRNAIPARPYRFFEALWRYLKPSGNLLLVLVEQSTSQQSRLVSGSILLTFGRHAFWAFTGTRENDFSLHPNDLTIWQCLQDCCRNGFQTFDLGEVPEDHPELARFKEKWGTVKAPMYRYYYSSHRSDLHKKRRNTSDRFPARVARMAWRKLPLSATACLSDRIYRYL